MERAQYPVLAAAALAVATALFLAHAYAFRDFVVDDAFITFRYARHIAEGLGPVFNPGERVEGFSNPLLTAVLSGFARAMPGEDALPIVARLLGVASGAGCLVLLARLGREIGTPGAALAMLYTATSTSFALWSVAGLETVPYALLVLAGVVLHVTPPRGRAGGFGHGLLLAAIALSRPEGALLAGTLFLLRLSDRDARRDKAGLVRLAIAAALPCAGYLAFRLAYYGEWLPNTYFAKQVPLAMAPGLAGKYLGSFVMARGAGLFYLPALATTLQRRRHRAATAALAVVLAQAGFIVAVGGDWMHQHRFVAPVVPLIGVLVAEGLALLALASATRLGYPSGSVQARAIAIGFALAPGLILLPESIADTRSERNAYWVNAHPYYESMGRLVRAVADSSWTVAADDVGAIGWYGHIRVLDLLGLTDAGIAHRHTWADARIAGIAPELIVLHYDDRVPPRGPWRIPRVQNFDLIWSVPRSGVQVPGALRVRQDVRGTVEQRLANAPHGLRESLARLHVYLATHQPDGLPPPRPAGRAEW